MHWLWPWTTKRDMLREALAELKCISLRISRLEATDRVIIEILRRPPAVQMFLALSIVTEQSGPVVRTPNRYGPKGRGETFMATMHDNQQGTLAPTGRDVKGNPAPLADAAYPLAFVTDNTDLLALTPAPDGRSCLVAAIGPLGTANVTVNTADNTFTGVLSITVDASAAKTFALELTGVADAPTS